MVTDTERGSHYISQNVPFLFELLKDGIKNRVDPSDYYDNWNHLVSFISFIIRCVHCQTDKNGYEIIVSSIDDYLNGDSYDEITNYITYFGNGRLNYKDKTDEELIDETIRLYKLFIKVWNDNYKNNPHLYIEACFANCFNNSNYDRDPNFSGSFRLLFNEYSLDGKSNTIKLFNCIRSKSDKPRLVKIYEGFKII